MRSAIEHAPEAERAEDPSRGGRQRLADLALLHDTHDRVDDKGREARAGAREGRDGARRPAADHHDVEAPIGMRAHLSNPFSFRKALACSRLSKPARSKLEPLGSVTSAESDPADSLAPPADSSPPDSLPA